MFAVIRQSGVPDNPPAARPLLLSTSHRVVQTFVMTADGFDGFTIWFGPDRGASAVLIELGEIRADATRILVGRFVVPAGATTARHIVRLSPIAHSAGKTFWLDIRSVDDRTRAPSLVSNRDNTYTSGTLRVDGREQWGDLAFSTTAESASPLGRLRRQIRERTLTREAATWLTLFGFIGAVLVLSLASGVLGHTHPIIRRLRLPVLLFALSGQLLLAGWYRWPVTMLPIQTPFDYGTGHVAVSSENWRRHGALRQHFMPRLSTDLQLPEWPFRTPYAQDYYSIPPLAFILHYGATRTIEHVDPVLVGKILAQALIAVSVLAAAFFLFHAFGAWSPLVGLSFLIWGTPFLLWFANGYFAVNVGLAVQLVLVSWVMAIAARSWSSDRSAGWIASVRVNVAIGAALAFLGAFADYLPLMANAIAVAGLVALIAVCPAPRGHGCRVAGASAGAIFAGTVAAVAATALLYGRQMGFARYWNALTNRIADRSAGVGRSPFEVIRQQMLTAWPPEALVVLAVILALVLLWCSVALVRRRCAADTLQALVLLLALAVSIGPSFYFHYRAVSYVSIHWWFAGTWTIGCLVTLCAFVWVLGRVLRSFGSGAAWAVGYQTVCVLLLAGAIGTNLRFVKLDAWAHETIRAHETSLYRMLGRDLPRDGAPLVVDGMPGLFEDYPYTTAYLRRPVVVRDRSGLLRLPGTDGERADHELLRRGGALYIAYDPYERQCAAVKVPLSEWHRVVPIEVCRASASELVRAPDRLLGPNDQPAPDEFVRQLNTTMGADCCDPERTLAATRSLYRRLFEADAATVNALRHAHPEALERLADVWRRLVRGAPASSHAEFKRAFLVGPIVHARRWYVLLVNLEGEPLPEFGPSTRLVIDGRGLTFVRPYHVRTREAQALLPFTVVEVDADSAARAAGGSLELWDGNRLLMQTQEVFPLTLPARGF